jgi:Ca2+-binding EF-hand superfamily protein
VLLLLPVCFKVFDKDHDGQLNERELIEMLQTLDMVRHEYNSPETLVSPKFY